MRRLQYYTPPRGPRFKGMSKTQSINPALRVFRNVGMAAVLGGLCYGGYRYGIKFGNLNPFAKLQRVSPLSSDTGISLKNVRMRTYHDGKLTAKAHLDKVEVSTDRTLFHLTGVKDGVFKSNRGDVKFAADKGTWNSSVQQLTIDGMARVKGKDFDLQSPSASFDRQTQELNVRSPLAGKLFGGKFAAQTLYYNLKSGEEESRNIHWKGKIQQNPDSPVPAVQADDGKEARTWDIDADHNRTKNGVDIFENARATDGEILVYAPHVERDKKTDVLTATGRATYFSGKADVVADKVVVYRKEKRAVFTGNVLMLVKPKKDQDLPPQQEPIPDVKLEDPKPVSDKISPEEKKRIDELRSEKNLHDFPVNVRADEVTYWYQKGQRHAIFNGNPQAIQHFPDGRWREGWATSGTYDGEKERMHLAGTTGKRDVRYRNSFDDIYDAGAVDFSTKEDQTPDEEDTEMWDVHGSFKDVSGEDDRSPKKKPGQPTTSPKPPDSTNAKG
ncbi:MAG TPA: LptA/OstA family protein [Fimbriimonas sp.]|nr:LptA/OstA family protein [Fimbriimonas sp.]